MKKYVKLMVCVVVVVGCVLFGRMTIHRIVLDRQMMSVAAMGRSNVVLLGDMSAWPRATGSGQKRTSTDFFNGRIRDEEVQVSPSCFIAPGLPHPVGDKVISSNNAWCVVELFENEYTNRNFPLLFTRNIAITNLSCGADVSLSYEAPFGRKGAVIITATEALTFNEKEVKEFFSTLDASNRVMRP